VWKLLVSGPTVYVGGRFATIGGQPRNHIAALDEATGLATGWDPNANGDVYALAVSGSTVYVGGDFTTIGGQPRNHIAALDAATGLATAWDPNANDAVLALAVSGPTVYVGGEFTTIGGQPRSHLAAVGRTTGLALAWDPGASYRVWTFAASGSTVYVGGSFSRAGGQSRSGLAVFDLPGTGAPEVAGLGAAGLGLSCAPSPFRSSTLFRFSLPAAQDVTLRVYDVAGRVVRTLIQDERRGPGAQQVELRADSLPAGLYFYRLEAGEDHTEGKMVHLK
jgi:hypothetical protein